MYQPNSITEFQGQYRFLSNFYSVNGGILLDGVRYRTVEHAYQAAKTLDDNERCKIMNCESPGDAKRAGKKVTMRDDWDTVKLEVMYELVKQKFDGRDRSLQLALLQTGDRELIEGNNWNDRFWGVCRGEGENHLGKILMRVREELRTKRIET